jgi:hypothetical protein
VGSLDAICEVVIDVNDVTSRLAAPCCLPAESGKPAAPSLLDLGGASRRTAGLSPSEARERERKRP